MKTTIFLLIIAKLSARNLNQPGAGLYRRQGNSAYPLPDTYNDSKYKDQPVAEKHCSKFVVDTDPCFKTKDRSKVKRLPKNSNAYAVPFKKSSRKYKKSNSKSSPPLKRRKPKKRNNKSSRSRRRLRYTEPEPFYPNYANEFYAPQAPAYLSGYSMPQSPPFNPTPDYNNGYPMPPPTDPNTGYPVPGYPSPPASVYPPPSASAPATDYPSPAPAPGQAPALGPAPTPPMNPQPYYPPVDVQTYINPGYPDPNYYPYPANYQPPQEQPYAPIY